MQARCCSGFWYRCGKYRTDLGKESFTSSSTSLQSVVQHRASRPLPSVVRGWHICIPEERRTLLDSRRSMCRSFLLSKATAFEFDCGLRHVSDRRCRGIPPRDDRLSPPIIRWVMSPLSSFVVLILGEDTLGGLLVGRGVASIVWVCWL